MSAHAFAEIIRSNNPAFDDVGRRVVTTVYRELARGAPVALTDVAEQLEMPVDEVSDAVGRCNVRYEGDAIVAFGGLSLTPTDHIFELGKTRLFTWCAWDPLFIAPILGREAQVSTTCPVTDRPITFSVTPGGVTDLSLESAVLCLRVPDESCRTDTVANFCSVVRMFVDERTARSWIGQQSEFFIVDLDEAFELGRIMSSRLPIP